jgi:uncharacterized protein YndB with AHSA1/START domain
VEPLTVTTTISKPREEVFEYLADIANHPEFSDHYLTDWHLTRADSYGTGAGARCRIKARFNRFSWADMTIAEAQRPYKIVEHGRGGKYNRIRMLATWSLQPGSGGTTRVEYTIETLPVQPSDRFMELVGGRGRTKRQVAKSMRRLRSILEDNRGRGKRASVAGRD